ncbi:DVU_1555 family C-GCAxxG-C-C protein [Desulfoscipio gibsoniae]|uniref:Putative redox-active protein (C_GCAxxG_C_C) n=1 Tax=Desulfoscipio gibsoniae DSM 7213 TaxID=767817 RepID=R4KH46_9FIRM|nr:DV_1555 family C-GCAxxG-C-C protein [Desulfoscipio gibsoniae]AGK99859.1 Putative redox-active protein (C_GCAxxG_C_C) [Desulfoscipio gibsoniae DSM 7213]
MTNELMRMLELHRQGFNCSQILLALGLESRGEDNPGLIRSMTGLGGGLGFSGKTCGALTGGVCLLSLYAGRGTPEEKEHDEFLLMVDELVQWFEGEIGQAYGGINCGDILGEDLAEKIVSPRCSSIVIETYNKVKEIMLTHGVGLAGEKDD